MKRVMDKFRKNFVRFVDRKVTPYYVYCGGRVHGWNYNAINDDKVDKENKYLLIQKDHVNAGLMEDYINFLLVIDFALSRGWIPVIDRLTYPAKFQQEEQDWGKRNGWETYFEQPYEEYTVEYVRENAANVMEATPFITFDILEVQARDGIRFMQMFLSKKWENVYYAKHLKEVASKFIRFNSATRNAILKIYNEAFRRRGRGKVLAVSVREEMLIRNEPTGVHLDNLLSIVQEKMEEFNCTHIFVASEFEIRIEEFCEAFGDDVVLFLDRKRLYSLEDEREKKLLELSKSYTEANCEGIFKLLEEAMGPKYDRWLYYLAEIYCVSCCDSAILQASSGNIGALIMKEGDYDNVIMLNDLKEFKN